MDGNSVCPIVGESYIIPALAIQREQMGFRASGPRHSALLWESRIHSLEASLSNVDALQQCPDTTLATVLRGAGDPLVAGMSQLKLLPRSTPELMQNSSERAPQSLSLEPQTVAWIGWQPVRWDCGSQRCYNTSYPAPHTPFHIPHTPYSHPVRSTARYGTMVCGRACSQTK